MKEIKLTKGYVAIVDDEDFDRVSQYKWSASVGERTIYVYRSFYDKDTTSRKNILLHRFIVNNPTGLEVDHVNHNGLDNRKENLRICTRSQNKMNSHKTKKTKYKYKGISLMSSALQTRNKPYRAQLRFGNVHYSLGVFETEEEAAKAYDEKAKELFGEFACLNFK